MGMNQHELLDIVQSEFVPGQQRLNALAIFLTQEIDALPTEVLAQFPDLKHSAKEASDQDRTPR